MSQKHNDALELPQGTDPLAIFDAWFAQAQQQELNDPNAMALASVDSRGRISQRMVLLKEHDAQGFYFYTNFNSRKGQDLLAHHQASLLFHWKSLRRQVRIEGKVTPVSDALADEYFTSRPRGSQIGAWASQQSALLETRASLVDKVAALTAQYQDRDVPRPPHWSGFCLRPDYIELWQDGADRLHDRFAFTLRDSGRADSRDSGRADSDARADRADAHSGADLTADDWQVARLYP